MKYLDTSAFVKHYRNKEEGSAAIHDLMQNTRDGKEQLISSFLVVGETVSVFDKWTRYKFISSDECFKLVKIFLKDIKELSDDSAFILEPVSMSTITNCLELITKHHLSLNDAIHLYTALGNKSLIDEFICSDEMLLKAAKSDGFKVFNPEDNN